MAKIPWRKMLCLAMTCILTVSWWPVSTGAQEVESETVTEYSAEPDPGVKTVVTYSEPEETKALDTVLEEFFYAGAEEDLPEYLKIPLYFQTDYPDTMYGAGTISSSGCSITCLAMVASYMTGYDYQPDELARYFGGKAQNNIKRLEYGSEALGLPFQKAANINVTMEGLKAGKVAIALMKRGSLFTRNQHFIVLTGITEDGKIMVNDPNEDNYEVWNLKKGLRYGFDEKDILKGYDGAWLYDKSQMPENPEYFYEEELDKSNPRYPDIELTESEIKLLAKVVWVEAQGESFEGQQAVAEVVLNRLNSERYPDNLHDVIYQDDQFRSVPKLKKAKPNQTQYEAIERAIYGPYLLPEEVMHFATFRTNEYVWGEIGGHIFCYEWGKDGEATEPAEETVPEEETEPTE